MTIRNPKAKGSRNERRSIAWLSKQGYRCTKSGGSLGEWDIIGIGPNDVVLVQVKTNCWPSPAERKRLGDFYVPNLIRLSWDIDDGEYQSPGVRKVMHRWNDHAREPEVREV